MLCLLAATAPAAWGAGTGLEFTHHDWTLACDNTRTCRAAGYQDYDDVQAVSVLLTRAAGPDTAPAGRVMLGQYDDSPMPGELSLHIDGRNIGAIELAVREGSIELAPVYVDALVDALARDTRIEFVGDDGQRWKLSDKGAAAVMLKMDEFQGRLDTPGALVRRGRRSEAEVHPPLPAPVLRRAPLAETRPGDQQMLTDAELRPALLASLPDDEECGSLETDDWEDSFHVTRLDGDRLLVSARCWMAAYNEGYGYWVVNDAAPYEPRLVTTGGSWDDGSTIHAGQKGRGLGDCWWQAGWVWTGSGFVQSSESTTGLCRLVAAGGAWDMPTIVSDVVR